MKLQMDVGVDFQDVHFQKMVGDWVQYAGLRYVLFLFKELHNFCVIFTEYSLYSYGCCTWRLYDMVMLSALLAFLIEISQPLGESLH